jgi:hypothetical protein
MKVLRNGKAVDMPSDPREPRGCPTPGACSCIAPDPRDALIGTDVSDAAIADATIERLSGELEVARRGLERLASLVPFPTPDELGFIHPQVTARAGFARAVLAKLSKGA